MRKDGTRFHLEVSAVPMTYAGRPHVLYVGRDISERKRSEKRLRASEEQYRAIFNAAADALVLRDAEFRIVDVNPAYVALSGFSRDEVIGKQHVVANPPETEARIRALHAKALAGEPVMLETVRVSKDGTRRDVELRGVPILHRGEPHVLYIGRDISERKRTEERLRASEEQYRSIFNAATDALVLRDDQARVVDVNPAFLEMSGFTREEVISRPALVLRRPRAGGAGQGDAQPRDRRRVGRLRGAGRAQGRHAARGGDARGADPVPRPAARARHGARHHRAEARRSGARAARSAAAPGAAHGGASAT